MVRNVIVGAVLGELVPARSSLEIKYCKKIRKVLHSFFSGGTFPGGSGTWGLIRSSSLRRTGSDSLWACCLTFVFESLRLLACRARCGGVSAPSLFLQSRESVIAGLLLIGKQRR